MYNIDILKYFRENLRCLNIVNDHLEVHNNMIGNKQVVRDSWLHKKV